MSMAAGHTVCAVMKQKEVEAGVQFAFSLIFSTGRSPRDGALHIQDVLFVQLNLSANTIINMIINPIM